MTAPAPKDGKSWPLFLLAGLSLIPALGFFFGFAAACWGLVTDRPRGLLAAALGGAGALLNIVVLGAIGFATLGKSGRVDGLARTIARMELDTLVTHIEAYREAHGRYPERLGDLPVSMKRPLPLLDHSISLLNTTVQYHYRPGADGRTFEILGAGKDGVVDTPDDIFPSSWDEELEAEEPGDTVADGEE